MEWTDESITRLRSLWHEGLSTAEIGRRMQITKNAVVGKAHRLTLSPRPSPIRKAPEKPEPTPIVASAAAMPRPASSASPEPAASSSDATPPQRRPLSVVGAPAPRAAAGDVGGRRAAGAASGGAGAPPPRPHLLLAARRARHQGLPLLRRRPGRRQAVLRHARGVGLRADPRSPGERRLTAAQAASAISPSRSNRVCANRPLKLNTAIDSAPARLATCRISTACTRLKVRPIQT